MARSLWACSTGAATRSSRRVARAGEPATPQIWRLNDRATEQSREFASQAEAEAELQKTLQPVPVTIQWSELSVSGPQMVRDLWRQKDLGPQAAGPGDGRAASGTMLIKVGTARPLP